MQNTGNPDGDPRNSDKNNNPASNAQWWMIVVGVIVIVVLGVVSIFLPNMKERVKFFTENALNASILTAIFVQAYIYTKQWKVMRKQSEVMDDTLVYSQRAYMVAVDVKVHNAFPHFICHLKIRNSGNTPANDVRIFSTIEMRGTSPDKIYEQKWSNVHQLGMIGPSIDSTVSIDAPIDLDKVFSEERRTAEAGFRQYCWGIIEYRDIFPKTGTRRTKFCFSHTLGLGTDARPCPTWNEAE